MTSLIKATFTAPFARRIPDPNFKSAYNAERHIFVVPVHEVPRKLPLDPNARRPKINRRVYQKVRDSLFNIDCEPRTFHLKNKGITIVAQRVSTLGEDRYQIDMIDGVHGILDGGHTHDIITSSLDDETLPTDQYITIEVLVGLPQGWIPEIAGGLNTSVQVQDMSLDNLAGRFEWLKKLLSQKPYYEQIAWSENDEGPFDARDIISLMTMFNIEIHPNEGDDHPVYAYEKKSTALKQFEKNMESYKRLEGLVSDILRLHDIVRLEYRDIWNEAFKGKAGALSFSEKKKKGEWQFYFTGESSEYRMVNGALYPLLAAFRWYVALDPKNGRMRWRKDFDEVLRSWRSSAPSLLKATHEMSNELNFNPQSVGKSRPHWSNLHNLVAKRDLQSRAGT